VKFAVLGTEESCTDDPAKRAGNEFLFQMQAMNNIMVLNGYEVTKIVTGCPHCFNTLKNELMFFKRNAFPVKDLIANIIKTENPLISENSKKYRELKEKINASFMRIDELVRELGVSQKEIQKISQKIKSMVFRIKEIDRHFQNIFSN
jgi:septal ring factor EnvC (AmiA/AmiB activator)